MNGKLGMSGTLKIKKIKPKKEGMFKMLLQKIKPFIQKKFGLMLPPKGVVEMYGSLEAIKINVDGDEFDYGIVSRKNVTSAFVNYLVTTMTTGVNHMNVFTWHQCGTGTSAASINDVILQTCTTDLVRTAGTQTTGASANIYSSVATKTFTSTGGAITEHGIFSSSSSGVGTDILCDRHVFAAINCSSGDSIQFTYALTATAEA